MAPPRLETPFLNPRGKRLISMPSMGFPGGSVIKESACQCRSRRFDRWVRKIPWSRKWQPTPVFFSGKSHGQRNLTDYLQSIESQKSGADCATEHPAPCPAVTTHQVGQTYIPGLGHLEHEIMEAQVSMFTRSHGLDPSVHEHDVFIVSTDM